MTKDDRTYEEIALDSRWETHDTCNEDYVEPATGYMCILKPGHDDDHDSGMGQTWPRGAGLPHYSLWNRRQA